MDTTIPVHLHPLRINRAKVQEVLGKAVILRERVENSFVNTVNANFYEQNIYEDMKLLV
jgi:hypothetical protein